MQSIPDLNNYTNEELVQLIQEKGNQYEYNSKDYYWYLLEQKTENVFHYVFHKYINEFYKKNMKDDIYSILKLGWVKAVQTYDIKKATAPFHAYASYIMYQQYRMFIRRIKEDRIGKSVRDNLLSSAHAPTHNDNNTDNMQLGCEINILKDESSINEFHIIEIKDLLEDKLSLLKEKYPDSYMLIYKYIYNNISQKDLCKIYNLNQSSVSKKIKRGLKFLREEIEKDNKYLLS